MSRAPLDFPRNLQPWTLLSQAVGSSRAGFVASFADASLLAVRVDRAKSDLERTLVETSRRDTRHWPTRTGQTGVTNVVPISDGFMAAVAAAATRQAATPQILRDALGRNAFYLLRLGKRSDDEAAERVTIGRSAANDVVLKHDSVSVSHAWIERDDRLLLYLGDDGSTNGTQLNGHTLDPGEIVPIASGDVIRFGEVEAVLVNPGDYWDLVINR